MLSAAVFRLTILLSGQLPLTLLQRIGGLAGRIAWHLRLRSARVTRENIDACYPGLPARDRERLAARSMVEYGRTAAEAAFALAASRRRCIRAVTLAYGSRDGIAAAEAALAAGRPLMLILPHLGNWEMVNHVVGRRFAPIHMYQPTRSRGIDAFIRARRGRSGARFVPAGPGGIRRQLVALGEFESVSLMPDLEPDVHTGQFAPFFGISTLTSTLAPGLARRHDPLPVLCWCERLSGGRGFRLHFRTLDPDHPLTPERLNAVIEAAVRERPEQYLWQYKRFRTRPAGEPERYRIRDHPARSVPTRFAVTTTLRLAALLPLSTIHRLARTTGALAATFPNRYRRLARRNLELCRDGSGIAPEYVLGPVLVQTAMALMETGGVWHRRTIDDWLLNDPNDDLAGCLVLTPPHGNREVVMRWLASRYSVADHYYPAASTAVDDLIRRQRNRAGIALLRHDDEGEAELAARLSRGDVVTFCPDQQPRLRAGMFVPWFEVPALTDLALARLARGARGVVLTAAIRDENRPGFRLNLSHLDPNISRGNDRDDAGILAAINHALESLVTEQPDQYRWSDKRFNIRPAGEPKVY